MHFIYDYFDKLEDRIRAYLSRYPILYAFLGGIGVVTFWRGVWNTIDFFTQIIFSVQQSMSMNLVNLPWWDGPLSFIVGSILLLSTGLFVFDFIGSQEIISGLKGEHKLVEKTEGELKVEEASVGKIEREVKEISHRLSHIEKNLENKK